MNSNPACVSLAGPFSLTQDLFYFRVQISLGCSGTSSRVSVGTPVHRASTTPKGSSASPVRPTVSSARRQTSASIAAQDTSWGRASASHWSAAQVGGARHVLIPPPKVREARLSTVGFLQIWTEACERGWAVSVTPLVTHVKNVDWCITSFHFHSAPLSRGSTKFGRGELKKAFDIKMKTRTPPTYRLWGKVYWNIHEKHKWDRRLSGEAF